MGSCSDSGPGSTPAETERADSDYAGAELIEIPQPDLSSATDAVRDQISGSLEELADLERRGASKKTLATATGELGLVYFTYSFVGAAEACFRNAVTLDRSDYRWPYLLGYLMKMQGRLEIAAESLERANELAPEDRPTMLRLARVRLELSDNEAAAKLFERVLEIEEQSAPALAGLGRVASAAGDHAAAVAYFERALVIQPSASSVHHALGLAYRRLGDSERARTHLEQGGEALVQIDDPLLRSLIELGQSAEVYLVRAAQAMDAERWELATLLYPKALELDPKDFMTHKAYAFALEKIGDLDGALEQLDVALEVATTGDDARDRGEHAEIYRVMGGIEVLHGRQEDALDHFEKSIELDPGRLDSRAKLANALGREGRFEEALVHYDLVLEQQPGSVPMLIKRATALVNLGRAEEAIAAFELAVAEEPGDASVRESYAAALDFLGQPRQAAAQRAALSGSSASGGRVEAVLAEAHRLKDEGRYSTAAERFREILKLDTTQLDARYELATLLGHLGRYDQALEEFALILETNSSHRLARRGEITALLLLERYGAARRQLDQALKIMPRDRQLALALARLLATAPDPGVRSGRLAVEIASRVFADGRSADSAETLAAAWAEAGDFSQALGLQRQLVAAAERDGVGSASRLRKMLDEFEEGRPWRADSPEEILAILVSRAKGVG